MRYPSHKREKVKHAKLFFFLIIFLAIFSFLVSCIPFREPIQFTYSQRGIHLTSDPSGANVKIEMKIKIIEQDTGKVNRTTEKWEFSTPANVPKDRFVTGAFQNGVDINVKYIITVSKPGYKTIKEEIEGTEMKSKWHWDLEPKKKIN